MAEKWLVIDDSATIQRVIKLAFQDYDVLITEADSVQEGLRELSGSPPTLVIADAALAGVQSVHDFSRLQQTSPTSAFVILEGSYDHIDESQFRGAGFRHFLKKPFDAHQLITITRDALGRAIPHRFEASESMAPPPTPGVPTFSLNDEGGKSPPPLPGMAQKSLHEELENPFGDEGFDLGLDNQAEPSYRPSATPSHTSDSGPNGLGNFSVDPDEPSFRPGPRPFLEDDEENEASQIRAKPYHPEAEAEDRYEEGTRLMPFNPEPSYEKRREPSYNPQALSGMLEPMLRDEMEKIVRQTVEEYCRKHFAELAREYLLREIEKLSSERARLLVDK